MNILSLKRVTCGEIKNISEKDVNQDSILES